jgi:hypothetical protein
MKRLLLALLIFWMAGTAVGQTPVNVVLRQPDCSIYFTLTAASPNSVSFDNRQTACTAWTVTYLNNGFAALSLAIEGAPDNVGVPGAYGAFSGTLVSGVQPNVSITQATTMMFGYAPWMRMFLTVAPGAGTVTGRLFGYRQQNVSIFAGGIGPGGAFFTYSACNHSLPISVAAIGTTQIVPLVANQVIRICHVSFSTFPAETVSFLYGTGVNCAGGPTTMIGPYTNVLGVALNPDGSTTTPASNAVCINQSVAQPIGGLITYSQYVP